MTVHCCSSLIWPLMHCQATKETFQNQLPLHRAFTVAENIFETATERAEEPPGELKNALCQFQLQASIMRLICEQLRNGLGSKKMNGGGLGLA